jgi:hypothetical protein
MMMMMAMVKIYVPYFIPKFVKGRFMVTQVWISYIFIVSQGI